MKHKRRARKKTGAPSNKSNIALSDAQRRTLSFLQRYGAIAPGGSKIAKEIGRYPTKPLAALAVKGLVRQLTNKAVPTAKGKRVKL